MDKRGLMYYIMENNLYYIMENNLQNDDLHAKILSFVSESNFEESNKSMSIISNFIYQAKEKSGKNQVE